MFGFKGVAEMITFLFGHELVKNGVEKLGKVVVERTEKLMTEDPRRDVVEIIRRLETAKPEVVTAVAYPDPAKAQEERTRRADDPQRAKKILAQLNRAGARGDENLVMISLGRIVPRKTDASIDDERAIEVYRWLADSTDEHFDQVMEAMKHDPIAQFVRYWIGRQALGSLQKTLGFLTEVMKIKGGDFTAAVKATWQQLDQAAADDRAELQRDIRRLKDDIDRKLAERRVRRALQ